MERAAGQVEGLLGLMGSLGDAARIRILKLLEEHELSVVDLCTILQFPQSTISRHLKILAEQGWVQSRRSGTAHLYRMIEGELPGATRKLWGLAREQTAGWVTLNQDALRLERRLREREGEVQSFFATSASEWDRLRGELYGGQFTTAAMLGLLPGEWTVADLGCGTGEVAAGLAGYVKRVIGVDNSPAMLKAARKRTAGMENIELLKGDFHELPIETGRCDAAVMVLSLTYSADPARAMGEMGRIVRAGGRGVVVDLLAHDRADFRREMGQVHMGFGGEYIKQLMEGAGFGETEVRGLAPEEEARGPALFLGRGVRRAERIEDRG